jgi:hypothetical protein
MANTPPPPPLPQRSASDLLDELCVELRHVGVGDWGLPKDERVLSHIKNVCAIHEELKKRRTDLAARITELSSETNWQMERLLEDCLAFPKKMPYVREQDGIRRSLRCQKCRQAERHPDAKLFWFCESCLTETIDAIRSKKPTVGAVLFRTYNSECRCEHADDETVLACDNYIEELTGVCAKCLEIELKRQRDNPPVGLK